MDAHGTDALDRQHDDPDSFWLEAASAINWIRRPKKACDPSDGPGSGWFPDGTLNTCYNAVDRHVINGRADDVALVVDTPATGEPRSLTFAELLEQVAQCAGVLQALGAGKGDRVLIALPTSVEAVISMLACARIGAVHCVIRDDLTATELAARIDEVRPVVMFMASWAVEGDGLVDHTPIVDAALARAAHRVEYCVVVQRPEFDAVLTDRDFDWAQVMKPGAVQSAGCVAVATTDPLSVQDVSGADGHPEASVQDNGGHAVALTWVMEHRHGMGEGDVWWAVPSLDRPLGMSATVYAPLLVGAAAVVTDAPTNRAEAIARLIARHHVTGLLIAPSDLAALRQADSDTALRAEADMCSLRTLALDGMGLGGLDPEDAAWLEDKHRSLAVASWWPHEGEWPAGVAPAGIGPDPR